MLIKKKKVFVKKCDDYFVVLNLKYNAIFMFNRDVKVVWDCFNSQIEYERLLSKLHELNYKIEEKDFSKFLKLFAELGIVEIEGVLENIDLIRNNNQFDKYIDYCCSKGIPTVLHIEITNMCNLKCVHCFHDECYSELEFNDLEQLLKQIKDSSFIRVTFTGGEFGLYSKWKEAIECAYQNGLSVAILSNLTQFDDDDLNFISNCNPIFVRTSLYGVDDVMHDSITGIKGSFNKTLNNLIYLKNKGINVSASCSILKKNFSQIMKIKDFLNSFSIPVNFDFKLIPSLSNTKLIKDLMIDHKQYKELIELGIISESKGHICKPGTYRIAVDSFGNIFSCDSLRVAIGNIKQDLILNVIHGEKMNYICQKITHFHPEDCEKCLYEKTCFKCPGIIWNYSPFENKHHDIHCIYTKIIHG